jgi:hypothetical protein
VGSFWLFVALVNSSFVFASVALGGPALLHAAGAAATITALALFLMGSFASLIVAAVATVLSVGAALIAARPTARAGSRPSSRSSPAAVD